MPIYPPPSENPRCQCTLPFDQFFCPMGHMTECHHPYSCDEAGCGHLEHYELSPEKVTLARKEGEALAHREGYRHECL